MNTCWHIKDTLLKHGTCLQVTMYAPLLSCQYAVWMYTHLDRPEISCRCISAGVYVELTKVPAATYQQVKTWDLKVYSGGRNHTAKLFFQTLLVFLDCKLRPHCVPVMHNSIRSKSLVVTITNRVHSGEVYVQKALHGFTVGNHRVEWRSMTWVQ